MITLCIHYLEFQLLFMNNNPVFGLLVSHINMGYATYTKFLYQIFYTPLTLGGGDHKPKFLNTHGARAHCERGGGDLVPPFGTKRLSLLIYGGDFESKSKSQHH